MLEPDPKTGPIAREIAERALAGESMHSLVRELNHRHIPSPRGSQWHAAALVRVLTGPAYAGLLPHCPIVNGRHSPFSQPWRDPETGQTVSIGEGIVTPAERLEIRVTVAARTQQTKDDTTRGQRGQVRRLLAGILRCDGCGGPATTNGESYVCSRFRAGMRCPSPASGYQPTVDRTVTAAWVARLAAEEPGSPLLEAVAERWVARHDPGVLQQRASIQAALDDANAALTDLEDARYLRGVFIGPDAIKRWERLHASLGNRVTGLRRNLGEFPMPEADISPLLDPVQVREAWELATVDEQRDLLRLALDAVYLIRAGKWVARFDPNTRLRFVWATPGEPRGAEQPA